MFCIPQKLPLTKHPLRMSVRRGKDALRLNPGIDLLGKTAEFPAVHLFTGILRQPPPQPCLLGGAGGHGDDDFVEPFLDSSNTPKYARASSAGPGQSL